MSHAKVLRLVSLALVIVASYPTHAAPLGTAFSYQGRLTTGGAPANGNYDVALALFDDPTFGSQVGSTVTNLNVAVSNGLFVTTIDFGAGIFTGTAYWLAIGVRSNGSGSAFASLTPRQALTPSPYALYATAAALAESSVTSAAIQDGTITNADLANNAVSSTKIVDGTIVGADIANNTVGSAQLADAISLGDSNTLGRLDVFFANTLSNQPSITLLGSAAQISTFGVDGKEQIRLWGSSWGELFLFNSLTNNANAVTLSANSSSGGYLSLNNSNGTARARVDGLNSGGAVTLYQADGSTGAVLSGDNAGAGLLYLYQADGQIGVTLDGDSAGAGYLSLLNTGGVAKVVFDGSGSGFGGQGSIYAADGSLTISFLGESSGAGFINVNNSVSSSRVAIDGESTALGGEISVRDGNGTETLEFLGARGTNFGGNIKLNQGDGTLGVEISAETYAGDGGVISLKNAAGVEKLELDGDDGDGAAVIRLRNSAGTATITFDADLSGDGRVTTQELQITGGSDLSEQFDISSVDGTPRPGMVVCIDPRNPGHLIPSTRAYDRTVAGVISGAGGVKPGMLMGQKGTAADGQHPVALTGRVYCWVDAGHGAIQPGDLITTSDTPGYAMRVADHAQAQGAILGKAMTNLEKGKGLVLVLVSLQ